MLQLTNPGVFGAFELAFTGVAHFMVQGSENSMQASDSAESIKLTRKHIGPVPVLLARSRLP